MSLKKIAPIGITMRDSINIIKIGPAAVIWNLLNILVHLSRHTGIKHEKHPIRQSSLSLTIIATNVAKIKHHNYKIEKNLISNSIWSRRYRINNIRKEPLNLGLVAANTLSGVMGACTLCDRTLISSASCKLSIKCAESTYVLWSRGLRTEPVLSKLRRAVLTELPTNSITLCLLLSGENRVKCGGRRRSHGLELYNILTKKKIKIKFFKNFKFLRSYLVDKLELHNLQLSITIHNISYRF